MLIIGIAGGTGSGKTTVVHKIMAALPQEEVAMLPLDSYYKDNAHVPVEDRKHINFDHPQSIEFDLYLQHINQLKQNKGVEMPTYSYISCTRQERTITILPKKALILEGILLFTSAEVRDVCNIKVFVDADADDRLMRVIRRDIIERGRDVEQTLQRYEETVKPMHEQFIEPTKKYADVIVPQGGHNDVAIRMLVATIKMRLKDEL